MNDVLMAINGLATQIDEKIQTISTSKDEEIRDLQARVEAMERQNTTPPAILVNPTDTMKDPYTRFGYTPADFEIAGMVFEGARRLRSNPLDLHMPPAFEAAWREYTKNLRVVADQVNDLSDRAPRTRAMDTAESGFGQELVGAQYASQLWEAARNTDGIASAIPTIPMSAPTTYVPIDGSLPEMLLVSESTDAGASAYTTSKTGTNRRTLTAKKFTIQQVWSGEMSEDSIIDFVPMLREKLNASAALHLGSAMYNGDLTNAGTGNINSDDADPTDTRHYLSFDGIRHYFLVDDTGNRTDHGGAAITTAVLGGARGFLGGANNSVNSLDSIHWGQNPDDLRFVANWGTYVKMLELDEVKTVDKLGAGATIVTGQLAALDGVPIIVPAYATKTEADGKLSATAANNTLGQVGIFNRRGWILGTYRPMQLFFDRIQRTDQFLFELYTRVAFQRWGADVAAGVINIAN